MKTRPTLSMQQQASYKNTLELRARGDTAKNMTDEELIQLFFYTLHYSHIKEQAYILSRFFHSDSKNNVKRKVLKEEFSKKFAKENIYNNDWEKIHTLLDSDYVVEAGYCFPRFNDFKEIILSARRECIASHLPSTHLFSPQKEEGPSPYKLELSKKM